MDGVGFAYVSSTSRRVNPVFSPIQLVAEAPIGGEESELESQCPGPVKEGGINPSEPS